MRARGFVTPARVEDPAPILHELRLRRSPDELLRQRRACEISRDAHIEAMRYARPGQYEYEVQAAIEFVFRKEGSPRNAYPSIVASGANATILHYVENRRRIESGDLVLVDAGCELGGYPYDITRTFPVNRRFTLRSAGSGVLRAQLAGIAAADRRPLRAVHGRPGAR
jgi:Xaa-Pro aminopeptidase